MNAAADSPGLPISRHESMSTSSHDPRALDQRYPAVTRSGLAFDLILLSAVWMHVPAGGRARAFRKMINLLKPGGLIALTLRHGPAEPVRNQGAFIERTTEAKDELGRGDVRWTQIAIRFPGDGTGQCRCYVMSFR